MSDRPLVARIVEWLRAGYPNGVPQHDYVPLLALLRRQLTEDEVQRVSGELISESTLPPEPISKIDAGVKITRVTDELPHDDDIDRVRRYLHTAGWPFDNAPLHPDSGTGPDGAGPNGAGDTDPDRDQP